MAEVIALCIKKSSPTNASAPNELASGYGLLASQAVDRHKLLALCEEPGDVDPADGTGARLCHESDLAQVPPFKTPVRRSWAALLKRVFQYDVLVCPSCRSDRIIIAAFTQPEAIVKIL